MKNNMPNVPIHDLCIHPRENDLLVGSFGRSFWIADISPLQEINSGVLAKDIHLFEVEPQVLWILSGQKQVAANHQNYSGENAPKGIVVNYYLKNKVKSVCVFPFVLRFLNIKTDSTIFLQITHSNVRPLG